MYNITLRLRLESVPRQEGFTIKMYCSTEEIERKRQEARQKLAQKMHNSPVKTSDPFETTLQISASTSPRFKFNNNKSNENIIKSVANHHQKPYDKPPLLQSKPIEKSVPSMSFYGMDKVITAKMELISETMFTVIMSSFCPPLIDIFKTLSTRYYDTNTKNWSFQLKEYNTLIQKLRPLQPNLVIEGLPLFVLNLLKEPSREQSKNVEIDYSRIDPVLASTLLPFQEDGLRFGISKNGRCLIADDMGLGKTFQALAIANYYKEDWPLLIVTTASVRNDWEETILKYMPSVSVMHVQYMTSGRDYIGYSRILITSHDLMSRYLGKLLEKSFRSLIIDESHILKNYKAKVTQSATELAKRVKRVILLSGTPALNRPSELYSQISLLDNKFFSSFFEYSKRYCDAQQTAFGWNANGKSNLKELEIVLNRKFMIRRKKQDVIRSLPNKKQEVVNLDVHLEQFTEEDRRCLNALAEKYKSQTNLVQKHNILLTFFAETAKIKIPSVCSYILQILENDQKFLVFAHHRVMLNAIEDVIKRKNIKYIRIDGTTSADQRKLFMDKFQQDSLYRCAVLSITAANAGITLTAANLVLFAELHWNPSILSQAEARAHRIGQESNVTARYLLAKGTSDDIIWTIIEEKQKILNEVGLSSDSFDGITITKQDSNKNECVTEGLDITMNESLVTCANTFNIATYFNTPEQKNSDKEQSSKESVNTGSEDFCEDFFNDGFNDVLCSIDL